MIKIKNLTGSVIKVMNKSGEINEIEPERDVLDGKINQNSDVGTQIGRIQIATPMLGMSLKVDKERIACTDRELLSSLPEPDAFVQIYIVPASYLGMRKDFFIATEPYYASERDGIIYTSITTAASD